MLYKAPSISFRRGPNRWRDYELPKDILSWYCKSQRYPEPVWMGTDEVLFNGATYTLDQFGKREREEGREGGREEEREGGREGGRKRGRKEGREGGGRKGGRKLES